MQLKFEKSSMSGLEIEEIKLMLNMNEGFVSIVEKNEQNVSFLVQVNSPVEFFQKFNSSDLSYTPEYSRLNMGSG